MNPLLSLQNLSKFIVPLLFVIYPALLLVTLILNKLLEKQAKRRIGMLDRKLRSKDAGGVLVTVRTGNHVQRSPRPALNAKEFLSSE
jgi:hypothetical protein